MLTLQLHDELETQLSALVEREHTTPELFIQNSSINTAQLPKKKTFFPARDCGKIVK